jgi:hypothetical protein
MYHPHTANTASMEEIQRNIRLASSNDKHTVWIGGDFNLPEINWEDLDNIHVKENSKNADIHQEFIELTTNCGLNQLVNKPTRGDNTLDLFLTNKPSTTIYSCYNVLLIVLVMMSFVVFLGCQGNVCGYCCTRY